MAENFTYSNLPGYGGNVLNPYTALDKSRADYWSGEKQKNQLDLNSLYNDQFNLLSAEKNQLLQNQLNQEAVDTNMQNTVIGGIKGGMGGSTQGSIKNILGTAKGKSSLWDNPTGWWKDGAPGTPGFEATPKLIKATDGTMIQNPDYNLGSALAAGGNWAANTSLGKLGAWGAGAPSSIVGIGASLINKFGGDNDPTTHTGTEKLGTGLQWASTAWKVASMIPGYGTVAAPIAAVAAYFIGNSIAGGKADDAKAEQEKVKKEWDDKVLAFRRDMRKTNVIGGTKGADMNWWNTNMST